MRLRIFSLFLLFMVCSSASWAAHVVVLDDSTYVDASRAEVTISYRRTLQILDRKGKDAAQWMCMLDKWHKLRNFSATFADAAGKVVKKLKKGDLQMTELSGSLADDSYTYYATYTPATYPYTVTYEWTVDGHDGEIAYPAFCPMRGYDEQVVHASYTIQCAPDNPCRYKALQCDTLPQSRFSLTKTGEGMVKAVFNHLSAVQQESYPLPLDKQLPMVIFAPTQFSYLGTQGNLSTWRDFGVWQYGLLEGRNDLPVHIKQKVHELTDNLPTKREKIARLYQYLYDNTRYVSIQLGIGGYQPAKASEVAINGFGDCKGLSAYMIALLHEVSIPATYVAISTSHADLLEDFPNLNQLNHAIVAVPMEQDTLWLECTNARIPVGYVHEDIAGHEAILITPEGGKLVRLPQYTAADNLQESQLKLTVSEGGAVGMNCQIKRTNRQYEDALPLLTMAADERQKVMLASMFFPSAQVNKLQMEEEKGKAVINISMDANSSRYANVSGKRIFLKMNPLKAGSGNVASQDSRQSSFFLDAAYCDEENIEIALPEGYQVESMPATQEVNNQFASFKATFQKEGNVVRAHYRLVMNAGVYAPNLFAEFVKTRKAIATAYRQQLVLVK